jgi:hypothetical protein
MVLIISITTGTPVTPTKSITRATCLFEDEVSDTSTSPTCPFGSMMRKECSLKQISLTFYRNRCVFGGVFEFFGSVNPLQMIQ